MEVTVLHLPAAMNLVGVVSYLLNLVRDRYPDKFIEFVNERTAGQTALQMAVKNEALGAARLLGPYTELKTIGNQLGYLEYAIHQGRVETLKCLLEFPFSDSQVVQALAYAINQRRKECHQILKQEADKRGLNCLFTLSNTLID
jgi:hypothetical protein